MTKNFLGIDTSNYTTSVAMFGEENINLKKLLPVKQGELGLRQSDAVFHHTKQLPELFEQLFASVKNNNISAIGVSDRPRSAEGSYMPCFLVGVSAARILSASMNVPLYFFSHQQGHIAAALYSANRLDLLKKDFIAFHLSGGTTEAVFVNGSKSGISNVKLIAESNDLKAGQAVDRVGVMLGLPFPSGKYIDELAQQSTKTYKIKPSTNEFNFSLSGVQNKCEKMLSEGIDPTHIAKFCIEYIIANLDMCLVKLKEVYGDIPVVFSGGVSSNTIIKKYFTEKYNAVFAEPQFSSDNAMGAAILAGLEQEK